jgi:hypothetical protein
LPAIFDAIIFRLIAIAATPDDTPHYSLSLRSFSAS